MLAFSVNPLLPPVLMFAPVMLPLADTFVPRTLAPLMLAALVILPVELISPAVNKLPPVTLPLALIPAATTFDVAIKLPPAMLAELVMLPVAVTNPPVLMFAPVMLPIADRVVPASILPVVITAPALMKLTTSTLPPGTLMLPLMTLPVTLNKPVMYSPVVANTATFGVPPTDTKMLPPLTALMLDVPAVIGKPALVAVTPVN